MRHLQLNIHNLSVLQEKEARHIQGGVDLFGETSVSLRAEVDVIVKRVKD